MMPPTTTEEPVAGGITLPEDLTALNDKELAQLRDKIGKAFDRLNGKDSITGEELAEMGILADQMDTVKAEESARVAAAEERQAQRADLAARMTTEGEGESGEGVEDDAADAPSTEEATGDADVVVEDSDEEEDKDGDQGAEEGTGEPVSVAASSTTTRPRNSGRGPVTRDAASLRPRMYDEPLSIVASSDIPGVPVGAKLSRDDLSLAMHRRARGLGDSRTTYPVATLSIPKTHDVTDITDPGKIVEAWSSAHDVKSLVASGGWCAPSEIIYDFVCDFEAVDGLISLPTITSRRGGVRFPTSPTLKDVFADSDSGFTWTEDNDIAAAEPGGPTKPCFVIPCPEFDEVRLQAQGICVTAGNLTDRAYPELTNRYIDLVMAAHAHRINGLTISKIVDASTSVTPDMYTVGATEELLGALELVIQQLRDAYFMAEDQTLEIIVPRWVRGILRHDIARRSGVAYELVSNAQINTWFTEIGASAQFVSDWQMLDGSETAWPSSVDVLVYPAGTHTRLDGGSIDLGVVRDSTLNATNDYTAAWTEEFWQVLSRCADTSLVVTVDVCASGTTGQPDSLTCPGGGG